MTGAEASRWTAAGSGRSITSRSLPPCAAEAWDAGCCRRWNQERAAWACDSSRSAASTGRGEWRDSGVEVIADLRAAGTTVLYISHKMNEVFTLADRVSGLDGVHAQWVMDKDLDLPAADTRRS